MFYIFKSFFPLINGLLFSNRSLTPVMANVNHQTLQKRGFIRLFVKNFLEFIIFGKIFKLSITIFIMVKSKTNYLLIITISAVLVLLFHYFFLATSNIHPTIQVFISFVLLLLIAGVITLVKEKK